MSRQAWKSGHCRCDRCHAAANTYAKVWRAKQVVVRGAEPATRVSPRRVRRHVDELVGAGWSMADIARASGVHWITVAKIRHRRFRHVSRITERAILAVEP